jgi:hypothetical protein
MSDYEDIVYAVEDATAIITINRRGGTTRSAAGPSRS